jgi:hypothetical protein
MTEVDWSKAPVWATVRLQNVRQKDRYCWAEEYAEKSIARLDDVNSYAFSLMPDCWRVIGTRPTTQPAAWNGEGLPPVGTFCAVVDDGSLKYGQGESGEVVAHVEDCAVIRMSYGLGCFTTAMLRTPEQVAADEREAAILELIKDAGKNPAPGIIVQARRIYDAGWRKQEKSQ